MKRLTLFLLSVLMSAIAFAQNPPGGYGPTAAITLQTATVTLTSAQILNLAATPITIVPAPGSNKTILLTNVLAHYRYNSTAYTINGAGGNFLIGFPGVTSSAYLTILGQTSFIDQTSDQYLQSYAGGIAAFSASEQVNQPLQITVENDPKLGNGTVTLTILYSVVNTTVQ